MLNLLGSDKDYVKTPEFVMMQKNLKTMKDKNIISQEEYNDLFERINKHFVKETLPGTVNDAVKTTGKVAKKGALKLLDMAEDVIKKL